MDARTSATSSDTKIDYVARARDIAPLIAAAAPHMEARRQLTDDVLELLRDTDLFRLILPKRFGGPEVDLVTFGGAAPSEQGLLRVSSDRKSVV